MMHLPGAFFVIATTLFAAQINLCYGYKWITLGSNDTIPKNAVEINNNRFIGRARHFHLILPAEVYNSTYAEITACEKVIRKEKFEVLVASERCEWKAYFRHDDSDSVSQNIVRVGTWWKKEPIFIGRSTNNENYGYIYDKPNIASIMLSSNVIKHWADKTRNQNQRTEVFVCNNDDVWVDSSSTETPPQAISGGKTNDNNDSYVARILSDYCSIYPGQLTPEEGIATAVNDRKEHIESEFCQVLTGPENKYSWVWAFDGEIPDYAVVGAQERMQLKYIARINKTLGYINYSDISNDNNKQMGYEILVRNV